MGVNGEELTLLGAVGGSGIKGNCNKMGDMAGKATCCSGFCVSCISKKKWRRFSTDSRLMEPSIRAGASAS
jgi:hypothetical protein